LLIGCSSAEPMYPSNAYVNIQNIKQNKGFLKQNKGFFKAFLVCGSVPISVFYSQCYNIANRKRRWVQNRKLKRLFKGFIKAFFRVF